MSASQESQRRHGRYVRSACGLCRQLLWVSAGEPSAESEAGAPRRGASSSSECRRCRLNLSEPSRTCGICLEPVTEPFRYASVHNESWENSRCNHMFCTECMRGYARSLLADGTWSIRCPGERCSYLLVDKDMVKLLLGTIPEQAAAAAVARQEAGQEEKSPAVVAKEEGLALLDRYRAMRSADHGAHLREVLRSSLGEAADAAEAARASPAADSFEGWAAAACQACPKCLIIIRKEVGCNHVRCRCGADFCYGCGAPYEGSPGCICGGSRKPAGLPQLALWLQAHGKLQLVKL